MLALGRWVHGSYCGRSRVHVCNLMGERYCILTLLPLAMVVTCTPVPGFSRSEYGHGQPSPVTAVHGTTHPSDMYSCTRSNERPGSTPALAPAASATSCNHHQQRWKSQPAVVSGVGCADDDGPPARRQEHACSTGKRGTCSRWEPYMDWSPGSQQQWNSTRL